jgi:hypothetical protein
MARSGAGNGSIPSLPGSGVPPPGSLWIISLQKKKKQKEKACGKLENTLLVQPTPRIRGCFPLSHRLDYYHSNITKDSALSQRTSAAV